MDISKEITKQVLKVLVTGADGMLGNNIVRELIDRGHEVTCFIEASHDEKIFSYLPVKIVKGDLRKEEDLVPIFKEVDYVIHTAGITAMWPARSDLSWMINFEAVKLLCKLSKEAGIKRFVHIGTATSFGHGPIDKPGTELSPYRNYIFKLDYQDTKYKAQEYLLQEFREHSFPVLILNPTFMLGKYDSGNGSNKMVLFIKKGKVPGYSPGGKNYVNVLDVAHVAVNSLTMGKVGECYITGNRNMTYKESFALIAETLNVSAPKLRMPRFLSLTFGALLSTIAFLTKRPPSVSYRMAKIGCEDCYYSSEKAVRELNMPQRSIEDGVRDSLAWFVDEGLL